MIGGRRVRVLIIDDCPTFRARLSSALAAAGDFEVAGEYTDAVAGVAAMTALRPDVVALDLGMPAPGGVETVRRIMSTQPTPIVVVTDASDAQGAFEAIESGAVEVVDKSEPLASLLETLRLMSEVRVVTRRARRHTPRGGTVLEVVAIGASTGGPAAVARILRRLPRSLPVPILIAQHLAPSFLPGLVDWLRHATELAVVVGRVSDALRPGTVYFAPPEYEICLSRMGVIDLQRTSDPRGPSVDTLFHSMAMVYGARTLGVLLTGMGTDGAAGLSSLRVAGGATIAQDESTSVVFGMPRAAINAGAAQKVLPLDQIAAAIMQWAADR